MPLPDTTGRWGNFWNQDADSPDRPSPHVHRLEQFDEFLGHIQASAKPGFYYAHLMLPHVPWTLMPSGKEYPQPLDEAMLGSVNVTHGVLGLHRESEHWTADELPVAQALRRYLLQLRLVDRLIGRLVARLKQAGLYDASLIVVMADHGVSPSAGRRPPQPDGDELRRHPLDPAAGESGPASAAARRAIGTCNRSTSCRPWPTSSASSCPGRRTEFPRSTRRGRSRA